MQNAITGDEMRSQQIHEATETIADYDPWDFGLSHPNPAGWTKVVQGMRMIGGYDVEQLSAILNIGNDDTIDLLTGKRLPTEGQLRMILNMIRKFTLLTCGPYAYTRMEREGLICKAMCLKGMNIHEFAHYLETSEVNLRAWMSHNRVDIPDTVWGEIVRIVAGSDIA